MNSGRGRWLQQEKRVIFVGTTNTNKSPTEYQRDFGKYGELWGFVQGDLPTKHQPGTNVLVLRPP